MDKVQSSFAVLFLFLMECPLHLSVPYAGEFQPLGQTTGMDYFPLERRPNVTKQPIQFGKQFHLAHGAIPRPRAPSTTPMQPPASTAWIPHRPALVKVITIACIALTIALIFGTTISYVIYRLVEAEEKQQLASLYKNIKIPLLGDEEEFFEDEGQDESTYLLPENERELETFIHSVIRSKRRKRFEKQRLNAAQNLIKEVKVKDPVHPAKAGSP
uniref:Chromosome 19 open reading frame 18 n=1 Tax=Bos mutus grunniens TaxID=30521 RepID=A0A8B9XTC1_BOSMU